MGESSQRPKVHSPVLQPATSSCLSCPLTFDICTSLYSLPSRLRPALRDCDATAAACFCRLLTRLTPLPLCLLILDFCFFPLCVARSSPTVFAPRLPDSSPRSLLRLGASKLRVAERRRLHLRFLLLQPHKTMPTLRASGPSGFVSLLQTCRTYGALSVCMKEG